MRGRIDHTLPRGAAVRARSGAPAPVLRELRGGVAVVTGDPGSGQPALAGGDQL